MSQMNPSYLWWIPLLPFAGFLINGTLGRRLPRAAVSAVALFFTAIPAALVAWLVCSMHATHQQTIDIVGLPWIAITGLQVNFAFSVDHLTLIMLSVVTGVGFLIHLYSIGYMAHEEGYWRFFAYLNLFMFFMLVLVLSSSFLLLFVGWEGVGLASYLLIGFYFKKMAAAQAGRKHSSSTASATSASFLPCSSSCATSAPSASRTSSVSPPPFLPRSRAGPSPPLPSY